MSDTPEESTTADKGKRRFPLVRFLLTASGILLVTGGILIFGALTLYDTVSHPRPVIEQVEFEVPEGASVRQIAHLLVEAGLVEHQLLFRLAVRLEDSGVIKYGLYDMPRGGSPQQILEVLYTASPRHSAVNQYTLTVPEGLTVDQMAELFADPDAFLSAAKTIDTFAYLGVDLPTLDGFLMPNTYFFSDPPTPEQALHRMLEQFKADYARLMEAYPGSEEYDLVRIVTVASLIEEEARVDDERSLVAAVIYNRLEKNMPLEMDSTLQYILNKYGQRLLNVDKEVDSPYNTYQRRGLPPGPISNPGVESLRAALEPADETYLFFVSNADGETHTFSTTLREHNRAVAKYRKEIRAQRKALSNP